jgi:tetratricopeptide (TPR) repeat protein
MTEKLMTAEELRQQALACIRANEIESALPLLDRALALTEDEELRELITINKAGALIALEQNGPEVQKLPQIIMRRRNLRHLYLAAYNLQGKYEIERDFKRALLYAKIALDAAAEAGEIGWRTQVLIALGNLNVFDSRIPEAIARYEEVLGLLEPLPEHAFRRGAALQNLGYCRLLENEIESGIASIHEAIILLTEAGASGYLAESYIDLCYGYLEAGDLDQARSFGQRGLEEAKDVRQIRNAHYLLGEVEYKSGNSSAADEHFEHLAKFYPDFPHLKDLLLAIDLRGMVNLKL